MQPRKFDLNTGSHCEHRGCLDSPSWLSTPGKSQGENFSDGLCEALGIAWVVVAP